MLQLSVQFPSSGTFAIHTTVVDQDDLVIFEDVQRVLVWNSSTLDLLVRGVWEKLNTALSAGNSTSAVRYFVLGRRASYGQAIASLMPNMPAIIASYSEPQQVSLTMNSAEYAVNRIINGVDRLFLIYVFVDEDGVWRIAQL
jgi:hypothetical protein